MPGKKKARETEPRPVGPHILFRHLGGDVGSAATPGREWQVEYHDGRGFPCGLAWVHVPPPGGRVEALIKFVLVADDSRERGVTARLVEACRERGPG